VHVTELFKYPVKGLTGVSLDHLGLIENKGILGDRAIAIARDPNVFDPKAPKAISKMNFLMLAKDEALARLTSDYSADSQRLTLRLDGQVKVSASTQTPEGKKAITDYLLAFINKADITPELMTAPGHKFTDISVVSPEKMRAISIINMASIRALEDKIGQTVDPRRFRANIYFDSDTPFIEHDWIGRDIYIGDVRLKCVMRTKRCPATEVNPDTGERDIKVPYEIRQHFGHFDMGIYAEVQSSGEIKTSDQLRISAH